SRPSCRLLECVCCFLQQHLFNSLTSRPAHSDRKAGDLEFRPGGRHITQTRENKSADGVDSFGVYLKAKMFSQIVETRVPAHEKFAVAKRLDVKLRTVSWHVAAQNFLDQILHGDDSFGTAELVNHDAHPLRMRQKKLQQFQGPHC